MNILTLLNRGRAAPYVMMDLADHFSRMGHKSLTLNTEDINAIRTKDPTERGFKELCRVLLSLDPDVIFGYGGVALLYFEIKDGPVVDVFDSLKIPSVGIYYDSPFHEKVIPTLAYKVASDLYHMFVWDRYFTEEVRKLGFPNVHYMPIATNTNRYKKINEKARDTNPFKCDVSFVGSWTPKRELVLRTLLDFDLKIWGYGWENARRDVGERSQGVADNVTELPFIYNFSKVNVNVSVDQAITSLNMRVFDVMACEGFLVSDYKSDFEELFDYKAEVACYHHVNELPKLVRYYLDHEDERKAMAKAARQRVLREHSYKKRAEFIIERLQEKGIK